MTPPLSQTRMLRYLCQRKCVRSFVLYLFFGHPMLLFLAAADLDSSTESESESELVPDKVCIVIFFCLPRTLTYAPATETTPWLPFGTRTNASWSARVTS